MEVLVYVCAQTFHITTLTSVSGQVDRLLHRVSKQECVLSEIDKQQKKKIPGDLIQVPLLEDAVSCSKKCTLHTPRFGII